MSQKPTKPRKKKILLGCGFLLVLFICLVIALGTCLGGGDKSSSPAKIPTYTGPEVVYEITGTASVVDVTLSNATGGTEQFSKVLLSHSSTSPGYRYSYDSFPSSYLYISAQNQGDIGTVTVSIYVKGTLFKTATSSGAYVIANAYGFK